MLQHCCSGRMQLCEREHCDFAKTVECCEFSRVHRACGCKNVLHECRGFGRCLNIEALGLSVQKFIGPLHAMK